MCTFPEIDSLCFCARDAMIAVTISLDTLLVSMPCSSNRTLTPKLFEFPDGCEAVLCVSEQSVKCS